MDELNPAQRSRNMANIKSKDTEPEKMARSLLHRLGFRFRLQAKYLSGKPDIVLPKYKTIISVHECFWHGHSCRVGRRVPKSNIEYWTEKIARNKARDKKNRKTLAQMGWKIFVIWECIAKKQEELEQLVQKIQEEILSGQ